MDDHRLRHISRRQKEDSRRAFVASTNQNFTRYNSSVKIHEADEEISPSFRQHMTTALK
jgi:hypothetical protein